MMIAGDILGNFTFNVNPKHKMPNDKVALVVRVVNGEVVMDLDKDFAYRVLAQKDLIVAGLNKKLSELIQKHLENKANEEQILEDNK